MFNNKKMNQKNFVFILIAAVILGWGLTYTNCGSDMNDSSQIENQNPGSNEIKLTTSTSEVFPVTTDPFLKKMTDGLFSVSGNSQTTSNFVGVQSGHAQDIKVGKTSASFNVSVNGTVRTIAVQSDQKILIGGEFSTVNGQPANHIMRLNANGSIDSTFKNNIAMGANGGNVYKILVQPNGKILVGGSFLSFGTNTTPRKNLVRLNANGSIDSTFGINNFSCPSFAQKYPNGQVANVEKCNANVTSLAHLASERSRILDLALQSDGKILVGGQFSTMNGANAPSFIRLNTNGTMDSTFNVGLGAQFPTAQPTQPIVAIVASIAYDANRGIYIGGGFLGFNQSMNRFNIAKVASNGSVDMTFTPSSKYFTQPVPAYPYFVNKILLDIAGNKLLVAGDANYISFFTSFNLTTGAEIAFGNGYMGNQDIQYSINGPGGIYFSQSVMNSYFFQPAGLTMLQHTNGHIYAGGGPNVAFFPMNWANGLDINGIMMGSPKRWVSALTDFDSNLGVNADFSDVGPVGTPFLLTTTLHPYDTVTSGPGVYAMALQADGKILVGGKFTEFTDDGYGYQLVPKTGSMNPVQNLIRINTNGDLDL